ncbi:DUF1826 domain-containing protein [Nitrosovibrio sp. Nv4]|uniref:DUF1826 domain-containing protein n=1 Tax=Nitrosovibrio sp. Nv4 TaxID=1945880 RepID=UPI000BCCC6DC|nr:DUF1826 domain-containing protein [Nitrosovibrio sp. Nv4]SOD41668.1 Protein of unknown function [Nitrosovibrio sp. Nv4]
MSINASEETHSTNQAPQQYAWTTTQPGELIHIFDPGIQLVHWQRREDQVIKTYFEQAMASDVVGSGFRTVIRIGDRLKPNFLPDLPGREFIVDDIFLLSNIYSELLGCDAVGLRMEVLGSPMCPRFHVDRTGIRLACAYRGSGTEWIDDEWVDRSKLGSGSGGLPDEVSGLFDHRTAVEAAAPFDVILFKDSLWQGNDGRGAIHRSPAVVPENGSRILVVIDAIWN